MNHYSILKRWAQKSLPKNDEQTFLFIIFLKSKHFTKRKAQSNRLKKTRLNLVTFNQVGLEIFRIVKKKKKNQEKNTKRKKGILTKLAQIHLKLSVSP